MTTIEKRIPLVEGRFYGGNQAWFPRTTERGDGCGVMAAANLYYYYRFPQGSSPSVPEYMQTARQLYTALRPLHLWNPASPVNSWGLPFFRRTLRRMQEYFFRKGVIGRFVIHKGSKASAAGFIRESLGKGHPPILLLMGDPRKSPYNNHYLLVTGIDEEDTLIVSTWGQRQELPLGQLLSDAIIARLGRFQELS